MGKLQAEVLHPLLVQSLVTMDNGLRMIHNPFMVTLVSEGVEHERSQYVGSLNSTFKMKRRRYLLAISEGDPAAAVMQWVERPYRTQAFDEVAKEIKSPAAYWQLLAQVWRDAENPSDYTEEWRSRFTSAMPGRRHIMSEEDRRTLDGLPELVKVYRAGYEWQQPEDGLSWSLEEKVARFFSQRFNGDRPLYVATVRRDKITAYWSERSESEVLIADKSAFVSVEVLQ